jgi:DNA repair exonuclease SbcCD ATPase subunit
MSQLIILPRLLGFRLTGFQPIFRHDVAMSLSAGPHIILGGNGLGKTTIMQAIVFGLTGGTEEATEEDTSLRWDHRYFRGRLNATQLHTASVEVDFAFGKIVFTVRRGLKGPQVTGFRSGRSKKWIEDFRTIAESF